MVKASRVKSLADDGNLMPDEADEPKGRKGARKREKIIWNAAKLFAENGYTGTTLTDIATAVGTHPGSLYYHFKSRDEITSAVLERSMTTISESVYKELDTLGEGVPSLEKLKIGIAAHVAVVLSDDPYLPAYNRIINEVPPKLRQGTLKAAREYGHRMHDILVKGQQLGEIRGDLDPGLVRMLLFGSITWSRIWFKPDGRRTPAEVAEHLCGIFVSGIRPDAAAPNGSDRSENTDYKALLEENARLKSAVLELTLERLTMKGIQDEVTPEGTTTAGAGKKAKARRSGQK
ncbi:TetR family transcriptional regulator [Sphingobium sp. DEHP117]|uniref:TetR family transcriptional regulator n=1 Tax=Sphingobium sp. DEHP117 TaxID=2993436 RepID=UPI0027D76901|nr:TetR family transcriptional regulator [Sphingobium sp. DEHP117]MDQ4419259.1 TetR family transcriptional regulator [Sphingobium sp. DEHP117]